MWHLRSSLDITGSSGGGCCTAHHILVRRSGIFWIEELLEAWQKLYIRHGVSGQDQTGDWRPGVSLRKFTVRQYTLRGCNSLEWSIQGWWSHYRGRILFKTNLKILISVVKDTVNSIDCLIDPPESASVGASLLKTCQSLLFVLGEDNSG